MTPTPSDTPRLTARVVALCQTILVCPTVLVSLGLVLLSAPTSLAEPKAQFGEQTPARAKWVLSSTSKISSYIGASEDLIAAEAYNQAREVLSRALRIDPHNADILYLSGLAHFREGRTNPAVKDLTLSAQMNPKNPKPFLLHGKLERSKEQALRHFTTAIDLDKNNGEAYFLRA
jgi:tetratricopeptide (TPR) repeat protein